MTPDEQEALSRKYSPDIFMVLELRSGRLAVFGRDRKLLGITDRTLTDLNYSHICCSHAIEIGLDQPAYVPPKQPQSTPSIDPSIIDSILGELL